MAQALDRRVVLRNPEPCLSVPWKGTFVPEMGSVFLRSRIAAALFGKTRRRILSLLFGEPKRSFFLREIVRLTRVGQGSVQRELANLVDAELATRHERGNQVFFQANPLSPVYADLRSLVMKTSGVAAAVQQALVALGEKVETAFLYGSVASGEDRADSDVDVMVVGEVEFGEVVQALGAVELAAIALN